MKNKKFVFLIIGILILFTLSSFAETKKLKDVGRYTLVRIKGEVPSAEVMKVLLEKYAGDIKYGFDLSGYGDLFLPFMDQLKGSNFVDKELPIGEKIKWMLFRSNGKVKLVEDLEWAGIKPLPVYSFIVNKDYKNYEIIMPKPCGNIALLSVVEAIPAPMCDIVVSPARANINDPITVDMSGSQHVKSIQVVVFDTQGNEVAKKSLSPDNPKIQMKFAQGGEYIFRSTVFGHNDRIASCETKAYINLPPFCRAWTSCLPCKDYVGKPIIIDASQSEDPDGEVVRVDFEITDTGGNVIDTFTDTEMPFVWEKVFEEAGRYVITAVVTDDFGAMSEPCETITLDVSQKSFFFMLEAGPAVSKGTFTGYAFARAGFLYRFVESFSLVISAGPAVPLNNTHVFKTYFTANALLNLHTGPAFFGAGVGYTTKDTDARENGFDLVGNIGFDLFSSYNATGSLFFEGRYPFGTDRPAEDLLKLGLGFRILF